MSRLLLEVTKLQPQDITVLHDLDITVVTPDTVTAADISEIEISYGWSTEIGKKILADPTSKLRWVQTMSAGVDYMPLAELADRQVMLTNASGLKSVPIAQSVISYILHFARGLNVYQTQTHWQEFTDQYTISELPTVIFGTGNIGRQIAHYLKALGGRVYGVNTSGHPVDGFDDVVAIDNLGALPDDIAVVVDVLPGTDTTVNFFNAERFATLGDLYLFINVGRGTTVNQADLIASLQAGTIRQAALDVTLPEPLPDDSPLWQQPNLLLTQHTTWAEHSSAGRAGNLFPLFMKNLPSYLANEPLSVNVVDLTRGY